MKIAVICDLHLPKYQNSMQCDILDWAIKTIITERADLTIVAGDITAFGEKDAFYHFVKKINALPNVITLGNSDLRDTLTKEKIIRDYGSNTRVSHDDCNIYCLNEPTTHLSDINKEFLQGVNNHNVIITHHNLEAFDEESRDFLLKILTEKKLLFIHGHKHFDTMRKLGESTLMGIRGLDPDKVYGLPAVSFFEFVNGSYTTYEKCYSLKLDNDFDFSDYIGMSCYNFDKDIDYAISAGIKSIEIRLRMVSDNLDEIKKKILAWRKSGGRYLSVHMPDLKNADGRVAGTDTWHKAAAMALELGANGLTIHVPKAAYLDMIPQSQLWREFSDIMFETISMFPNDVKVGIENLHLTPGMKNDPNRIYGCIPEECIGWINELNSRFAYERVGAVFDIGHASNNGILSSIYTRSSWYELIGKKTVAYHIHQVKKIDGSLANHKSIDDWFGMNISYVSFLMAWQKNQLNHRPMFLEMSVVENVEKSIKALDDFISKL